MGGDDLDNHRKSRCCSRGGWQICTYTLWKTCFIMSCLLHHLMLVFLQWQSELQQGGRAGAAPAAGEAEGGWRGHSAQRGGASQPAHPTGHGPQKPQQALPRLAGVGVEEENWLKVYLTEVPSSSNKVHRRHINFLLYVIDSLSTLLLAVPVKLFSNSDRCYSHQNNAAFVNHCRHHTVSPHRGKSGETGSGSWKWLTIVLLKIAKSWRHLKRAINCVAVMSPV